MAPRTDPAPGAGDRRLIVKAFDRFRARLEPAVVEQEQRREVARASKYLADHESIRSGYLRGRAEERSDDFEGLMEESQGVLARFDDVDLDGLVRAAAACVVHEQRGGADRELWRPVWSERFDETGRRLRPAGIDAAKAEMLWLVAHYRSFGALPSNGRLTEHVRRPLNTVPFYVFVNAPVEDVLDIAAGCGDHYRALIDEADDWFDPGS